MLGEILENVRERSPLIQNITNYVTANDCANITLACGASPTMSDGEEEAEEMGRLCDGLNINMGTLHPRSVKAMLLAGKSAAGFGRPIVLDPVGAGASTYRRETAEELLREIPFTAIRGNISEIKTISGGRNSSRAVIAISGAVDIVTDTKNTYIIRNGHPVMAKITGCGCMLSSLTAAYLAANPDRKLEAVAAAVITMGLCGEKAYEKMAEENSGNAGCRNHLIDEVYKLTGRELERGAKYELR